MKYIDIDPQIMSGEPVIAGTRIPVSRILALLGEGYTFTSIKKEFYPHVSVSYIKGAAIEAPSLIGKVSYGKASAKI